MLLGYADRFPPFSQDLYLVRQTASEYLPKTISTFLSMPPDTVDRPMAANGGRTARQELVTQLDLLDKKLDGFGELFRMLSYQEVGPAAMLSRACAGTIGSSAIFALPGSERAVRLAMEKLILPEIGHVVRELNR